MASIHSGDWNPDAIGFRGSETPGYYPPSLRDGSDGVSDPRQFGFRGSSPCLRKSNSHSSAIEVFR